ncbi:hypothetical protein BBR47_14500 [Brevibacillus brevis NBRC 100599]|uniref:Uncharacterized protein n=1 Tax=Brevibacillus brevis (strain 47 / JCM 6285 / NBRC 100599) TaxID=358681 RepID=C0Z8V7_BREBN|nr:hypothetical protein BBR47_14500 [Brevibacillus brevis NBRC 100599]
MSLPLEETWDFSFVQENFFYLRQKTTVSVL